MLSYLAHSGLHFSYTLTTVVFKSLKHITFDQALLRLTTSMNNSDIRMPKLWSKTAEWSLGEGKEKARDERKAEGERERQRREINGFFPPVNCLLVYAEGSRGGISQEAQVKISLLLPLISGRLDPSLLLPPRSVSFLLQSHDCRDGIKKRNGHVKESLTNWILTGHAGRQAERGRKIRQTKSPPASRKETKQEVSEGNSLITQLPALG